MIAITLPHTASMPNENLSHASGPQVNCFALNWTRLGEGLAGPRSAACVSHPAWIRVCLGRSLLPEARRSVRATPNSTSTLKAQLRSCLLTSHGPNQGLRPSPASVGQEVQSFPVERAQGVSAEPSQTCLDFFMILPTSNASQHNILVTFFCF